MGGLCSLFNSSLAKAWRSSVNTENMALCPQLSSMMQIMAARHPRSVCPTNIVEMSFPDGMPWISGHNGLG